MFILIIKIFGILYFKKNVNVIEIILRMMRELEMLFEEGLKEYLIYFEKRSLEDIMEMEFKYVELFCGIE